MNSAQKAVVSAAKKDGLSPMEIASELMNHDITEVVLGFMRKREVAFNKLSETEQDSVIAELGSELKKITATACRVINANGVETVGATLKSLKIDGKLTATMVIEGDEPNRHVLTDKAHDKSSILIVLYPNSYSEGMSAHQGERDQKPLDLDEPETKPAKSAKADKTPRVSSPTSAAAIAKKTIELTPKQIEDGREFIVKQQNCSPDALQNLLKINRPRAEALLKHFEGEGIIEFVGTEASGQYELVRTKTPVDKILEVDPVDAALADLTFDGDDSGVDLERKDMTTDELYEKVKAQIIRSQKVSVGALAVAFGADVEVIEAAVQRLEDEGVVSDENEVGFRDVLTTA